jgi:hypothetical protein
MYLPAVMACDTGGRLHTFSSMLSVPDNPDIDPFLILHRCIYAPRGRQLGQDCTAIDHAVGVHSGFLASRHATDKQPACYLDERRFRLTCTSFLLESGDREA